MEGNYSDWEIVWLFIANTQAREEMITIFREVLANPEAVPVLIFIILIFAIPFIFWMWVLWSIVKFIKNNVHLLPASPQKKHERLMRRYKSEKHNS